MTSGIVNIRGKDYQTVPYRVQRFWEEYAGCSIETDLLHADEDVVRMRAVIREVESGRIKAVGHAEEYRNASKINETSALENCETSAVGRALAKLGLAGDSSIASAEEVMGAVIQQETKEFLDRMEDNRNSGALCKNEPAPGKELSEKAPYYKGPATGPNNEPLEIAAWLRKTKE